MTRVWLGIGCDRGCDPVVVRQTATAALAVIGLKAADVGGVASIDIKSDEAAIADLAQSWAVPLHFYGAAVLERQTPRLANPSQVVFAHTGCHGVAEAAALVGCGPDAVLLVPKFKGPGVTVAVAGQP